MLTFFISSAGWVLLKVEALLGTNEKKQNTVHIHLYLCQTNVHQFQCSLHTCEIDYLIMGLCVHGRALICKYVVVFFVCLFVFLSPFHFIDNLWWYWRLCCRVGRLDDLMVFHQSFVTNETVILSCLCRGLLWMML